MWPERPLGDMSRNRVERLESTVVELESTIQGLTEELVEAKERIRVLETELDAEVPTRVPERRPVRPTGEAAPDDVEAATAEADSMTGVTAGDATDDGEANAENGPDAGDEAQESRTDDIIVA